MYSSPSPVLQDIAAMQAGGVLTGIPLQGGVPFVLPSGGSIANNGALTLTVALPTTFTGGVFMYFPAAAIAAGSAAGWYWTVMGSTTAGTIYNNSYSSGVPAVPAAPIPFATTGPGAYTQTVAAVTAQSLNLPANYLGGHGQMRITKIGAAANNADAKSVSTLLNASVLCTSSVASAASYKVTDEIGNDATNMQIGSNGTTLTRTAIDTTQTTTLNLQMQIGVSASDYLTQENVTIELFNAA